MKILWKLLDSRARSIKFSHKQNESQICSCYYVICVLSHNNNNVKLSPPELFKPLKLTIHRVQTYSELQWTITYCYLLVYHYCTIAKRKSSINYSDNGCTCEIKTKQKFFYLKTMTHHNYEYCSTDRWRINRYDFEYSKQNHLDRTEFSQWKIPDEI